MVCPSGLDLVETIEYFIENTANLTYTHRDVTREQQSTMTHQVLLKQTIKIGYFSIIFCLAICLVPISSLAQEMDPALATWMPWQGNMKGLCLAKPLYCGCQGYYDEPAASPELPTSKPKDQNFYGIADQYSYTLDGIAELLGNVVIKIDDLQVNAEEMKLDDKTETAIFDGNVQLSLPGFRLNGPTAEVATEKQYAKVDQAGLIFYESGLRGFADSVELNGNTGLTIENGKLTSCTPGDESWMLVGDEIDLNLDKGWGTIRNMRIEVHDVPVFYLPYFAFPLDERRQSGFLVPKFDISKPDLSIPYYMNLAPNYDLTLTPRYIGDRGSMLETEFRYLQTDFTGKFELNTLPNDEQRQAAGLESHRALFEWQHFGELSPGWDYDIDVNYVSDPDYFVDFGTSLTNQTQSFLDRALNIRYISPNWSFLTRFQDYQVLDETLASEDYPYRRSPEVQLNHFDRLTAAAPLFWDNRFSYTYFEQPRAAVPYAHRLSWHSILRAPLNYFWGQLEPKMELHHRRYTFNDFDTTRLEDDSYAFTIPTVSLDARLSMRKNTINNRYWQTLEPRLFLTHTPYEDQSQIPLFDTSELTLDYEQLFLSNPFIGGDRIADRQQVSVGLTSRLFEEDSGRLILRGDVGQGFTTEDRTPILTRLIFSPQERLFWTNQINWQDGPNSLYSASSRISYLRPRDEYRSTDAISLEYRYQRDDVNRSISDLEGINQYEIAFAHTLNYQLKLLGKVRYDNREDRTFEHIAGFTYTGCCWEASVVYHRLLENDEFSTASLGAEHSVLFEFSLKGLGGLGGGLKTFLQQQIPGFRPRGEGLAL